MVWKRINYTLSSFARSVASYADALWARHAIFLPHERLLKRMGCLIRPITADFPIKAANFEPWSIFARDVVRMADICVAFQRVCETSKIVDLNPFQRELWNILWRKMCSSLLIYGYQHDLSTIIWTLSARSCKVFNTWRKGWTCSYTDIHLHGWFLSNAGSLRKVYLKWSQSAKILACSWACPFIECVRHLR